MPLGVHSRKKVVEGPKDKNKSVGNNKEVKAKPMMLLF
jgi:hypothetical protein